MKSFLALAALLGVGLCLPGPIEPTLRFHARRQAGTNPLGHFVQEFVLDLSDRLWLQPDSVAFSPLSIASLMSMMMMGSSGSTHHQVRKALHYPNNVNDIIFHDAYQKLFQDLSQSQDGVIINIATRLFLQSGANILSNFTSQAQEYYGASVRTLPFRTDPLGSMNQVNDWVKRETQGKISQLLTQPFQPDTIFVATNTIYFNGAWETPFDVMQTDSETFYTGVANITVPMMKTTMNVPYINMRELNAEMIALPYTGKKFAMFLIVPKGPIEDKTLQEVEYALDAQTLSNYIKDMVNSTRNVALPRMKLNYKIYLKDTLNKLGVEAMFNPSQADFSKLTANQRVWVKDLVHKTVVEITETGTVATAATSVSLNRIGTSNTFKVNRPALFFIRHMQSGLPLFWGRILEPEPFYATSR